MHDYLASSQVTMFDCPCSSMAEMRYLNFNSQTKLFTSQSAFKFLYWAVTLTWIYFFLFCMNIFMPYLRLWLDYVDLIVSLPSCSIKLEGTLCIFWKCFFLLLLVSLYLIIQYIFRILINCVAGRYLMRCQYSIT